MYGIVMRTRPALIRKRCIQAANVHLIPLNVATRFCLTGVSQTVWAQSWDREERTQHSHDVLQQGYWILVLDDHDDKSNMNHIVFADEVIGKGCEGVQSAERYVLGEPSFVWELVFRNVEAIELRRSGQGASSLDQPYPVSSD